MNNETFGMTFQYAICLHFEIENDISIRRIDKGLLKSFIESKIVNKIMRGKGSFHYHRKVPKLNYKGSRFRDTSNVR